MTSNPYLQYARALYNLAVRTKVEEQLWHELKAIVDLVHHKKIQKLMENLAHYPQEIREKILDETFGNKIHSFLLHLVKILEQKGRMKLLPQIYKHYSHFYHEAKGIREIMIYTARELEKEEEHALVKEIETKKACKITAHFETKPELIGGIQIYENGYVTDYSVQHYLEQLQRHLLQTKIINQAEAVDSMAKGQQQSLL